MENSIESFVSIEELTETQQKSAYLSYNAIMSKNGQKLCNTFIDFFDYAIDCELLFSNKFLIPLEILVSWEVYESATFADNVESARILISEGVFSESDFDLCFA